MDTLRTSRLRMHGMRWRVGAAPALRCRAVRRQPASVGKWRARHRRVSVPSGYPPQMRGKAQRFVAKRRFAGRSGQGSEIIGLLGRRRSQAADPSRRGRSHHACPTNDLTQLKNGSPVTVTNITIDARTCSHPGAPCAAPLGRRAIHLHRRVRPLVAARLGLQTALRRTAARRPVAASRGRGQGENPNNTCHRCGPALASRASAAPVFVQMRTADGHRGVTGDQPVGLLASDMPARSPVRSTGEQ